MTLRDSSPDKEMIWDHPHMLQTVAPHEDTARQWSLVGFRHLEDKGAPSLPKLALEALWTQRPHTFKSLLKITY